MNRTDKLVTWQCTYAGIDGVVFNTKARETLIANVIKAEDVWNCTYSQLGLRRKILKRYRKDYTISFFTQPLEEYSVPCGYDMKIGKVDGANLKKTFYKNWCKKDSCNDSGYVTGNGLTGLFLHKYRSHIVLTAASYHPVKIERRYVTVRICAIALRLLCHKAYVTHTSLSMSNFSKQVER